MYQRLSAVLFPVLAAALIGTGYWGYQEHQDKNSLLIKAENQYQRSFHDLSYYMDQLQSELGKAMAVKSDSEQFQKRKLIQVWRITSQAQQEINQLPLTLASFNKTEEFLDRMANFTYRASLRDLTKKPLTREEIGTLQELYKRSKELSGEMRSIQAKVVDKQLRWMDVEHALVSEKMNKDNTIIDGFKSVDKKVSEYSEVQWGPSVQSLYEKRSADSLDGPLFTARQIQEKAAKLLNVSPEQIQAEPNGQGTEFHSFSAHAKLGDGRAVHMDFSKKGGHLLWFMRERDVRETVLTPEQARDEALKFLQQQSYGQLVPINYDEYNHTSSVTFAAAQDGIVLYPNKVTVQIAMDNGEVLGLQASDFLYEPRPKIAAKPSMTMDEAASLLAESFQRSTGRLAYVKNDLEERVLCYEFAGRVNGGLYRVFLNAETGDEEKVELLQPVEAGWQRKKSS